MMTTPESITEATAAPAEEIMEITDDMIVEILTVGGGRPLPIPPPIPPAGSRRLLLA
jgi:hypothetical protein